MKLTTFVVFVVALSSIGLTLSGCCGSCGDALQTTEGRKGFIEGFNEDNKDCLLKSENADMTTVSYTCKDMNVSDIEVGFKVTCEGYKLVGFKKVDLSGKDGAMSCTVGDSCECSGGGDKADEGDKAEDDKAEGDKAEDDKAE